MGGVLAAGDCVAVLAGAGAAAGTGAGPAGAYRCGLLALGVLLAACRQAGLYRPGFAPEALRELPALAVRTALAWGFSVALLGAGQPRRALLTAGAVTVATACSLRALVYWSRRSAGRRRPAPALVVGAGPAVRQVAAALRAHPEYGLRPVAVVAPGPAGEADDPAVRRPAAGPPPEVSPQPGVSLPVLAGHARITEAVVRNAVRYAVVVGPPAPDPPTEATLRLLAARGCLVWQVGAVRGPVPPGHLWGFACRPLELRPYRAQGPLGRWAKRALDTAVSGTALLCATPVLAVCALAVRLADGPGVIFRQERIGLGGRPFTLLKFRTLRPADEQESATRWNIADDLRVSRIGRLLRRTSMDELPQLWNVLRGDMSLVGPRPERPHFVAQFSKVHAGYQDRHRMPAGITGLAQVHGLRGDTSIADRARFDNHYIDSWSLWQDVTILLRTAAALFRLGGS
ncbi:sugar transferase [Actinacidiphila sp. ITFR-21]|uniref:sugar transferase n=1 Tax=Actinacidiphila sp. ITFR-21 TaxID=3075199 RepID=UPI0028892D21|nr:sugar transferase [Streptomyces sp. ITFR-21]WNI16485.1 sugar transferase [Streptomyces sp. ITFR-21]